MSRRLIPILLFVFVAGTVAGLFAETAASDGSCEGVQQKLEELTTRVTLLEQQLRAERARLARPAAAAPTAAAAPAKTAARTPDAIYGEIDALLAGGKIDEAQRLLADRKASSPASSALNSLTREMGVVGQPTPENWWIEKWYQGESEVQLDGAKPTLLVFWEAWCPHCKKEVPRMQGIYERFKSRGFGVVGVTRITRSSTEESVKALISESGASYPMAKETGALAEYFHVKGIPAAAVVKGGKIIWRGHPLRLTDRMLEGWL